MKIEKSKISFKSEKSKTPRTIKDIEDTLKEMDKIHSTSFYDWIKDENNASVIAFKTKDLFHKHYEKQPELVYNALRFLCKDWKISKIAELVLKLFYKSSIASQQLAIVIYEVSLLLENPEKVDLISLLLIGEEAKNVAFFLYHFFQYTEKKYREHSEILNEEEFLDEMNAFCSGMLECLYSILKWNDNYFKELIIEYINLSTLEIDARHEFLIRMVNVKYSRFQQEQQSISTKMNSIKDSKEDKEDEESSNKLNNKHMMNDNDNNKMKETEENFKKSLNFGILVFNMFQIVMRTEDDELIAVPSPKKEFSNKESSLKNDIDEDYLSDNSISTCNKDSKKIILKKGEEEEESDDCIGDGNMTISNTENDLSNISTTKRNNNEHMKKEESSATLWVEDSETYNHGINDSFSYNDYNNNNNNYNEEGNTSKDISSIYNFGYDSSYCKINSNNESSTSHENEYTESELYNTIDESLSESLDECSFHIDELYSETIRIDDDNVNNNVIVKDNDEDLNDINLFDDFFNKSFTSTNSNSRRNSTLSFTSFIGDHNLDEIGSNKPESNGLKDDSNSTRRNSRYSLNLSINSNSNTSFNSSNCNCSCNCRYNFTDNLLYIFPSPPNSPAIASAPSSPTFLLNDREHEFDFESNPTKINSSNNNNNNNSTTTINSINTTNINTTITNMNEMEDINNLNFLNDNDLIICCNMNSSCSDNNNNNTNNSLSSPPQQFYRSFSPETVSPSPIVQSLSADNLFLNDYGYSCTFNHIHSSPNLTPLRRAPN